MKGTLLSIMTVTTSLLTFSSTSVLAQSMAKGVNGYQVSEPIFTVGDSVGDYTPPGILDGLGATELDSDTVRVFANHELLNFRGYEYQIRDGKGETFSMKGARITFFDINKHTRTIEDAGLAYDVVYDANGDIAQDRSFLGKPYAPFFGGPENSAVPGGFSRFCSSVLVEAGEFNRIPVLRGGRAFNRGLEDTIYFTGEEDGTGFNSVGGAEWALDVENNELWQVPAMGRGAWENVTPLDTGNRWTVAFVLMDDSSPFDFDNDGDVEAAPLYLYTGKKQRRGDFLERNGLRDGKLYVWVADTGETRPSVFNTSGTLSGRWVEIDNSPRPAKASENGTSGYDRYGYPTQGNLWLQAAAVGAFGFSRPEDIAYNPDNPSQAVLASTGVDNYDVDPVSGNGADTFGTMYTIDTDFHSLKADLTIVYDGDADPGRTLRSPDNLDWADNGYVLVQEDEAEEDTLSGDEVLFGNDAANVNEAGIVLLDPGSGATLRVANIDRSVILDPTTSGTPVDQDAGNSGEWESSGILDVSSLFGEQAGTLFLFDVQAHGIEDQDKINSDSRINDDDLVEGGQLLFLYKD